MEMTSCFKFGNLWFQSSPFSAEKQEIFRDFAEKTQRESG